jgi:hypothetical protein
MDTALASRLVKESDHEGKGWILSHAEFRRKKREESKVKNKKAKLRTRNGIPRPEHFSGRAGFGLG